MHSTAIKDRLSREVLLKVENPGNYIGGEPNQVIKDPETVLADIVLAFPDAYELGMSNNGMRILYHLVNREADLSAERAFAPKVDMAETLRRHNVPLYSLENYRPLSEFTAIGISLQTELNFTNVPYVLELGGVQSFSKDRTGTDPFVIGGGPCMANPEPVADFFDFFVIGDGERITVQLLRLIGEHRKKGASRSDILKALSEVKGVYVPQLVPMQKNERDEWVPFAEHSKGEYSKSKGVQRVWIDELDPADYPVNNVVPNATLVHNRYAIEVMRGCTQGCRFCQAGYWYRPNREIKGSAVVDLAKRGLKETGERELGLLSLSTADYSQVEAVTDQLATNLDFQNVSLSLPSLRANSYGQGLAAKVSIMNGGQSSTFAPETGSERLRKLINKTISDKDMYEAAEGVFQNGFRNIKLYTMVGLPTENLEDMEAFCGLIEGLHTIAQKYGRSNTIHASVGIFIPKPFTPMQWVPFMEKEKVMEHIFFVVNRFRRIKTVRISWSDWGLSFVESLYSRGDRSLAPLIYEAYKRGKIFESFSEHFDYGSWMQLLEEKKYPINKVLEGHPLDSILPWDYIHAGVNKAYLKVEHKKMFTDTGPVPDCKWGDCQKCGIPGNYLDTKLALEENPPENMGIAEMKKEVFRRKQEEKPSFSYLLHFEKVGLARFIAHQALLSHFEKAFRRSGIFFQHSKGFNSRPIIKNGGALPLGLESRSEILLVQVENKINNISELMIQLNGKLPEGINILSLEKRVNGKFPKIKKIHYSLKSFAEANFVSQQFEENPSLSITNHKGKVFELKKEVSVVRVADEKLVVEANTNDSGASVSPYLIFSGLTGLEESAVRQMEITKELSMY